MGNYIKSSLGLGAKLIQFAIYAIAALMFVVTVLMVSMLLLGREKFSSGTDFSPMLLGGLFVVFLCAAFYKLARWFGHYSQRKLLQHQATLETFEADVRREVKKSIANAKETQLARAETQQAGRSMLQHAAKRTSVTPMNVTVLGGTGWESKVKREFVLSADENNLYLADAKKVEESAVPLNSLIALEIAGPGTITEGGGFVGGGFGVEGFVVGAAISGVLNALTTSTSTQTLILLRFTDSELVLLNSETGLDAMRIRLSSLFHRTYRKDAFKQSAGADVTEQLTRLAELAKRGELSDDEYAKAKAKVLDN